MEIYLKIIVGHQYKSTIYLKSLKYTSTNDTVYYVIVFYH